MREAGKVDAALVEGDVGDRRLRKLRSGQSAPSQLHPTRRKSPSARSPAQSTSTTTASTRLPKSTVGGWSSARSGGYGEIKRLLHHARSGLADRGSVRSHRGWLSRWATTAIAGRTRAVLPTRCARVASSEWHAAGEGSQSRVPVAVPRSGSGGDDALRAVGRPRQIGVALAIDIDEENRRRLALDVDLVPAVPSLCESPRRTSRALEPADVDAHRVAAAPRRRSRRGEEHDRDCARTGLGIALERCVTMSLPRLAPRRSRTRTHVPPDP